jgi:hypothetical protein
MADEAGHDRLNPVRMADAAGNDGRACERSGCSSDGKTRNCEEAVVRRGCGLSGLSPRKTGFDAVFDAWGWCCGAEPTKGFVDAAVVILAGVCDT